MSLDIGELEKSFNDFVRLYKPKGDLKSQVNQFCNKFSSMKRFEELLYQKLTNWK